MDFGDQAVSVRNIGPKLGNRYRKFGLEGKVSNSHTETMKPTLKMLRILLRSAFQAAIFSLSFFA